MSPAQAWGRRAAGLVALALWATLPLVAWAAPAPAAEPPHVNHLFTIVLENESAATTFGANPPAPYLATTLRGQGAFIPNYYGIGHASLDNYIAMISGQPPNTVTQADCPTFVNLTPGIVGADGIALGQGCVFPGAVQTVANQLEASGHSWRGYMQDMASSTTGEATSCRHPVLGGEDKTEAARPTDQYASRHDPFVYFHSVIDYPACQQHVVDLSQLQGDLASEQTTPEYAFITPDLCADGHDASCADGSSPGGFAGIEAFLREWVPRIEASAAYRDRGAILITFDESASGAESCCGETTGPNTVNNGGGTPGSGGGKVGAVVLSPCTTPGTVTDSAYNHYAMLRWVEDNFGLGHLANAAAAGLAPFGSDVFSRPSCEPPPPLAAPVSSLRLKVSPRKVTVGKRRRPFHFHLISSSEACLGNAFVSFGDQRAQFNRSGHAQLRWRPARAGKAVASASTAGCGGAKATVRVLVKKRHRPKK